MRLAALPPLLRDEPGLTRALGDPSARLAIVEVARPVAIAALASLSNRRPLVVACPTGTMAAQLGDDLAQFLPAGEVAVFPAWETLPFERVSPSVETMGQRLELLWRLRDPDRCPTVIVTGVRALLQRLGPDATEIDPIAVRPNDVVDPDELVHRLAQFGYRREELVEHRGEFARRGAIIDVFPSTGDSPIRIDLWGDEVDRLTRFGVNDQRSIDDLAETCIFPARELIPSDEVRARASKLVGAEPWGREQWERLSEGALFDGMESWLPWLTDAEQLLTDVLPDGAKVILVEPRRMRDRAIDLLAEEDDLAKALASTWERDADKPFPRLHAEPDRLLTGRDAPWSIDSTPESPDTPLVQASGWGPITGDGGALVTRLTQLLADGYRVVVAADGDGSADRLAALLRDHGLDFPIHRDQRPDQARRPHRRGPAAHGRHAPQRPPGHRRRERPHRSPPGPPPPPPSPARLGRLLRGPQARQLRRPRPARRRLATRGWSSARSAASSATTCSSPTRATTSCTCRPTRSTSCASTSAARPRRCTASAAATSPRPRAASARRCARSPRSSSSSTRSGSTPRASRSGRTRRGSRRWRTPSRTSRRPTSASAIDDVKADMERPYPMDRLVCGDVGFGKTEVAIRAAFKAIQDGKQVAVLTPTTLLATQHGNTFADRFAGYPIRVETLSRFLTPGQARDVVRGIESGAVDCVIGTHRLLGEQVRFKDLGLLVVDEEQRFGVTHKEAMKQLKTNVDVLTLTATPIPRTLEMSLVGIRDLSLLQTPPADRQPILTYVGGYDERVAVEAIRRELLREGQVFWVHNRVRSIEHAAARLRELVPEARIAVAHGQMDEGTLEQVVVDFWDGQFDVLVCTTIIESGIDMPTVNTLVVERSDLLGLGQLHQLRGRVGRSGQRAYAYLFHPVDTVLTEEAYERLKTIGEATELGSGFKIAMRDLEIRGAGNLLGEAQSGHIAAVGYDLYCQMVTEAVAEMKGEVVRPPAEIKLDVPTDAFLPNGLRRQGGAAPRGLPPPRRGHDGGAGRRHPHRVGGPLRPAAGAGRGAADRRLPARRVQPARRHRRGHRRRPGPPRAARAEAVADDPAAPPGPQRHLQGGRPPARRADPAAGASRPRSSSSCCATWSRWRSRRRRPR